MFRLLKFFVLLLCVSAATRAQADEQVTQTIELYPGWNLISIQVADSDTGELSIPQFLESIADPGGSYSDNSLSNQSYWDGYVQFHPVLEIWAYEGWTYDHGDTSDPEDDVVVSDFIDVPSQMQPSFVDPETGNTRRNDLWRSFHSRRADFPRDLVALHPNKAYWVRSSIRRDCQITGKLVGGDLSINQGWNFIGFNMDPKTELVTLDSILGNTHAGDVSQIWGYDASSAKFYGYDLFSSPPTNTLSGVEPGQGYWLYANQSFLLTSEPQILLPSDIDESPLSQQEAFGLGLTLDSNGDPVGRYVGATDEATLATYQTIGFVKFVQDSSEEGEVLEDDEDYPYDLNGNGIIDTSATQDTIRFASGVDRQHITLTRGKGISYTWEVSANQDWINFDEDSGDVSGAQDTIVVSVDRTTLSAGKYGYNKEVAITLTIGEETSIIYVQVDVPTIEGDWFGYATLNKVNGKSIGLGKVDLFLNSSMEGDSLDRFTTVLNSDRSLLFPRDVFMNGIFYTGKNFSLTTNFSMVEGDINAPGYETFTNAPQVPGVVSDYDQDGDGVVDNMNPFPYRLHREVTLQGTRYQSKFMKLDEDDEAFTLVSDDRLEGVYVETVRGLLPNDAPILIEGSFVLKREEASYDPTKKTVAVLSHTIGQTIGGTNTPDFSDTLTLDNHVDVTGSIGIYVDLTLPTAAAYRSMILTLVGPDGLRYVLQKEEESLLNNGHYTLDAFDGQSVTGDWVLQVEWNTSERGTLVGWSIDIKGTTANTLSGNIIYELAVDPADEPILIEGAVVVLTGTNIIQSPKTSVSGEFNLDKLNENRYKMFILSPNHLPATVQFVLDADGTVSQIQSVGTVEVSYADSSFSIGLEHLSVSTSDREFEVIAGGTVNEGSGNVFYARLPDDFETAHLGGNLAVKTVWSIDRLDFDNQTWEEVHTAASNAFDDDEVELERFETTYHFTAGLYRMRASIYDQLDGLNLAAHSYNTASGTAMNSYDDRFTVTKQSHSGLGSPRELIHWAFLGSLAARMEIAPEGEPALALLAPSGNILYQESQPDSAAFDIDRDPLDWDASPGAEDTDHTNSNANSYDANTNPALLRCVSRMGFPVFSTSPASAGSYQIHPGLIDPQILPTP
jgi:hypothetical protein